MKKEIVVDVEHLTVNYDKTAVLWDVSLSLPAGKLIGILGPNGAGKSTLLKALIGAVSPITGSVTFWGKSFKKSMERVAYVPQRASVDWDFPITVLDVVLMGRYGKLRWFKGPGRVDRQKACAALETVGMLPFSSRQISELSGGQQQRVFVARALMQEADLYLMDEPLAGIDFASEKAIMEIFIRLRQEGKTVCIVYHDLNHVETYFDWVVILNTCLIGSGPTQDVFTPPNLQRAYGSSTSLLTEVAQLSQKQTFGAYDRG